MKTQNILEKKYYNTHSRSQEKINYYITSSINFIDALADNNTYLRFCCCWLFMSVVVCIKHYTRIYTDTQSYKRWARANVTTHRWMAQNWTYLLPPRFFCLFFFFLHSIEQFRYCTSHITLHINQRNHRNRIATDQQCK